MIFHDILGSEGVWGGLKGSKVLVLGIAYKKNVDDMRESPSVLLMEKLQVLGGEIAYSDPYIPTFPEMREHHFDLDSVSITAENIAAFDVVILATDHDSFDYDLIRDYAKLLVDTRGRYEGVNANVFKA